jgi:hypothetical protein
MDKILMNENNNRIITDLIELIDKFSVLIYERENNESYGLLINIIDKIDLIVGVKSTFILENKFKIDIYELTNRLPDLLDAFENNDNVLISDILKYEIKPLLEKFI